MFHKNLVTREIPSSIFRKHSTRKTKLPQENNKEVDRRRGKNGRREILKNLFDAFIYNTLINNDKEIILKNL